MIRFPMLCPAPIFVIWPLVQGRYGGALRWICGMAFGFAVITAGWLITYIPADRLAELGTSCPDHFLRTKIKPLYVDATADLVCAYKPQFAHYAACEAEDQLERTIEYIHRAYPGIPVILDAKRGDVDSTAERYAIEAFERYGADAVTVNPYLGGDSLELEGGALLPLVEACVRDVDLGGQRILVAPGFSDPD